MKQSFIKTFYTPEQHITLLKNRGMIIQALNMYRFDRKLRFANSGTPNNTFKDKLKALLAAYPNIDIRAMGFPFDWEDEAQCH